MLKGGLALELRLQLRARATGDYDAAFRARAEEAIDHLDEALAAPWNHLNLTRDVLETIPNTKAMRVRLRLSYKGRTWGSVQLEMAPVEGRMGLELDRVKAMSLDQRDRRFLGHLHPRWISGAGREPPTMGQRL